MSIEALLEANTAALKENTAALLKAAGSSASTGTASTGSASGSTGKGKGKGANDEPKINQDQMTAALVKLKEKFGADEAKAIVKSHGKAEKMAEIKPAQFQAVYEAAVAKFEELENGGGNEGGDDI